jgi:type 1 glutamine amidotransferase
MRKHPALTPWLAALALAAVTLAPALSAEKNTDRQIKVLIIDGQNNHNWRATTPHLKKVLQDCGRFTVDVATAPERRNPPKKPKDADAEKLAQYEQELARYQEYRAALEKFHPDLDKYDVVLSNYNGDLWSKQLQKDLDSYVKSGKGGLVIVHAANNSFPDWEEYDRMIGMGWRGNRYGDRLTLDAQGKEVRVPRGKGVGAGHGRQHAFAIVVRDGKHPITKGMPTEWQHAQDELYQGMRGPIENVHLLATAYADKSKGGPTSSNEHEPMIWTVTYGKGRVFHTPMGHDLTGMRCIGFITTLQRGTEWAATGKVTIPIPSNFPTAAKTSSLPSK